GGNVHLSNAPLNQERRLSISCIATPHGPHSDTTQHESTVAKNSQCLGAILATVSSHTYRSTTKDSLSSQFARLDDIQQSTGMFLGIPGLNKFVSSITISEVDDFPDRCNYFYTVLTLLFFSLLIGTKQHFGAPIRCLVDRQYSGSWIGYVHDYCFISERYSLIPPEYEADEIAAFDPTHEKKYENYYQWVPFLLAAQALSFYVPHFLWRWFQKLSSKFVRVEHKGCENALSHLFYLDMAFIVAEATQIYHMFRDERSKALEDLVRYLEQCLVYPVRRSVFENFIRVTLVGWYSSLVYVLEKLLNIANTVLQLYVVNAFVGDGTLLWGYQLIKDLWTGKDWATTGHFPRVVYCDYIKHELANVQRRTVQCALAINILNEKVFAVMSAWLLLLLAVNIISAIYTVTILFIPTFRERSVSNYFQDFVCREEPLDDNLFDNDGDFCEEKLSEDHFSNITSAWFHSKIRRRLCGTAECDETVNIESEKTRESKEQKQAIFYRQLILLAHQNKYLLNNFICEAIHPDSILLLHFIQSHVGRMVASDILFTLWADYVKAKESRRHKYQPQVMDGMAYETPTLEENLTVLSNNRYFNVSSSKNDSMDADLLLKPKEQYAQVVSYHAFLLRKKIMFIAPG
ncbi:innexin family protein, partial [Wuchereria bancrofti]